MVYKVIGLMSGSSLDGLDIAYVQLEYVRGKWGYNVLEAECIAYSDAWQNDLKHAHDRTVGDFLKLHTAYGRYLGTSVREFMTRHDLEHKVHFIASHGHTVIHEPASQTTGQIGDGASIAAIVGLPVISDLRLMDMAYGGQGAPIVPIGDKLLFADYDYLLNIGGIANVTIQGDKPIAFDVCPANQVLNALAHRDGNQMDLGGAGAAQGKLLTDLLEKMNNHEYYRRVAPKSLSNEAAMHLLMPLLAETGHSNADLLHTVCTHIAAQVAKAVQPYSDGKPSSRMLVTGGGAHNTFLITELQSHLNMQNVEVVVPDAETVNYKEAVVMALIGALRWREEVNVISSVTGASQDSIGGALWLP